MREYTEVMDKFLALRAVKLKERKSEFLGRLPINCSHNMRLRVKGKGQVGFCQNSIITERAPQGMFVCDDEVCRRCRLFACRNTEESVEREFDEILRSPSRCGNEYPKLAVMIWFLQEFETPGRKYRLGVLLRRFFGSLWGIVSMRWW